MIDVDLVVPYVDSCDKNWQVLFNKYNPIKDKEVESINAKNRFRGQGDFFEYFFIGIEKFAPWIRNIFLILQSSSQTPNWIYKYKKVKIIYHKDFIPDQYLPTFNSTCIELFVPFIPNLSEHFLYANDDTFIYNNLKIEDFFKDDKALTSFYTLSGFKQMYQKHCYNGYCLVNNLQNQKLILKVGHTIRPYFKSECLECFHKFKDDLLNSISRFREEKNINMYIYDYYQLYKKRTDNRSYKIRLVSNSSLTNIQSILNDNPKIICIQDTSEIENIYENKTLNNYFKQHYIENINYFDYRFNYNLDSNVSNDNINDSALPNIYDYI